MLRSREIPVSMKLGSLSIGLMATLLLAALEIPLEGLVAFLLPFVGPFIDVMVDGAEVVLLPILIGASLLPWMVKRKMTRSGQQYAD